VIEHVTQEQLDALDARHDLLGNEIMVGARIRSFDFPFRFKDGRVMGFSLTGERACYIEGVVDRIEFIRGCHRYVFRAARHVSGGEELTQNGFSHVGGEVSAPVNGVVSMSCGRTFGVFAITDAG
jgi:hypothetical protein